MEMKMMAIPLTILSLIMMSMYYSRILIMLMMMEFMIMNTAMIMYMFNNDKPFFMIFLIFSVCEAVVGLSLIAMMLREWTNDNFKIMSSIKYGNL